MKGCLSLIAAMIIAGVLIAIAGPIGALVFIVLVVIILGMAS